MTAFVYDDTLTGLPVHHSAGLNSDTWRDNAVLLERGDLTLRYRWTHVAVTPCRTAGQVAQALRLGGWDGQVQPCGTACEATQAMRRRAR